MDYTSTLCVFAEISGLFCKRDPLMLATLTRVCKIFNERIGSCKVLLEELARHRYFNDSNIDEIFDLYGQPSARLCIIYCSRLPITYSYMRDKNGWEEHFEKLFELLTASPSQRMNIIQSYTGDFSYDISVLLKLINKTVPVSTFGVSYVMIKNMLECHADTFEDW